MKHVVTLEDADIRDMVRKYVEEKFPGYTAATTEVRIVTLPTGLDVPLIEVSLGRPTQSKD